MKYIPLPDVLWFQEGPGVRNYQYTTEGVKLINVTNLTELGILDLSLTSRYIAEEEAYGKYKHFLCADGDLVIASSGVTYESIDKKIAFIRECDLPLCMNTSVIRFRSINDNFDINFAYWFFKSNSFKNQISKLMTGIAQLNFGPSHLKKIIIPSYSLEKQKDIINVLNQIKYEIYKNENTLEMFDELVKSRFIEMFGDPVTNSKELDMKPLEQLGVLKRGTSKHRPRNDVILLNGPYPLIQTGDVSNADTYINSYTSTYSEEGLKQSKMWNKGTLCITIAANIAQTAILNFDACFPDSVVGFIPNEKVTTLFIHNWFKFLQPILEENAPAVAQKNLNVADLGKTLVIIPSMDMQIQFESFIKQIDKSKFICHSRYFLCEILTFMSSTIAYSNVVSIFE